jgi:hypothetical protein
MNLEADVHDPIISGRHVEHSHGGGTDERIIEWLATQFADGHAK